MRLFPPAGRGLPRGEGIAPLPPLQLPAAGQGHPAACRRELEGGCYRLGSFLASKVVIMLPLEAAQVGEGGLRGWVGGRVGG